MEQILILDKELNNHPTDKGCEIATNYLGKQSFCAKCPFTEGCIKEIKYSTRILLQSYESIKQIYEAQSQGLTIEKINSLFSEIPFGTIQYWLRHKKRIQKLLNKYSWAIQYLT